MNDCSFVQENAAAHAVNALDDHESVRIDRHLTICPPCAATVSDIRRTFGLLPFVVPQIAPPPRAKAALFARVTQLSTSGPVPGIPVAPEGRTLSLPASTPVQRPVPAQPVRQTRARRFRPSWEYLAAPLAAVPLVFALAIVGGWAFSVRSDLHARSNEVDTLRTTNQALTRQIDNLAQSLPVSTAQRFALDPVDTNAAGSASYLLASPNDNAVTVVLREATGANAYRVICESKDGKMLELGDIDVDDQGFGANSWHLPIPASFLRSVHVQPAGEHNSVRPDTNVTGDVLRADMEDSLDAGDGTAAGTDSR